MFYFYYQTFISFFATESLNQLFNCLFIGFVRGEKCCWCCKSSKTKTELHSASKKKSRQKVKRGKQLLDEFFINSNKGRGVFSEQKKPICFVSGGLS